MVEVIQIVAGLSLLYFGGDILVDGSVALARKMNISKAIIGLTIVAFGTSAPEFVVNIHAVLIDNYNVAIGNVIGSNISNSFLILGVSGLFATIALEDKQLRQDIIFVSLITFIFIAFSFYQQKVGLIDGLIYLGLLGLYSARKYSWVRKNRDIQELDIENDMRALKAVTLVAVGIMMLVIGGDLTVAGAIGIAKIFNISDAVISVTIIAIGSSAPELAACVAACKKGHSEIAITNVVGSNIFNIVLGLGAIALFKDIYISEKFLSFDLWFLLSASLILLFFTFWTKKIARVLATIFVLLYITFVILQYINIG